MDQAGVNLRHFPSFYSYVYAFLECERVHGSSTFLQHTHTSSTWEMHLTLCSAAYLSLKNKGMNNWSYSIVVSTFGFDPLPLELIPKIASSNLARTSFLSFCHCSICSSFLPIFIGYAGTEY